MTTRICALAALLLALPATARAQDLASPAMPPAPSPAVKCPAGKGVVCGPARPLALGTALSGHAGALRSDRTRRGLGLPSLRRLFGRAAGRAEALADGRLTRMVTAARAASTARAAAGGGLGRVGSVGGVSVRATPAPGLGAGVDEISYTDQIKGPHGSQTRSIRFTATAAACPIAATGTDNVGKDIGNLLAAEHIVTVQRTGRLEIQTDFTLDTTGSREVWGFVNGRAELTDIQPKPTAYARIRRVRTARDLRTGRRYREKPLELSYELHMVSPLWMDGHEFDQFIDNYGNANGGDPADAAVPDRLLNEAAFEAAARTFMTAVESRTRAVFAQAEQGWRTPNHCVEVHSDAPEELVPGQSVQVHVSATSKRGDPAADLRRYARYAPYRSADLAVDPFTFVEPDADVGATFTVTPPAQAWADGNRPRLQVLLYSTGGIGAVDTDFRAQTLPIRYRILSASYSTHTKGSQPGGLCASFGGTSGWVTLSGSSAGVASQDDPNTMLGRMFPGALLSGGVWAKAATKISDQINGCKSGTTGLEACSMSAADVALPNPFNIGFTIQVPKPESGQATIHWLVNVPGVGDPGKLPCGVGIAANIPYDKTTQVIPLAKLLSTEPQTFTYADSIHFDQDSLGRTASIDYDWSYTITFQRM